MYANLNVNNYSVYTLQILGKMRESIIMFDTSQEYEISMLTCESQKMIIFWI